jgi:hypothetical protein
MDTKELNYSQDDRDLEDIVDPDSDLRKKEVEEQRASMWLTKIRNARNFELPYRQEALSAIKRYRGEKYMFQAGSSYVFGNSHRMLHEFSTRLNIFYSNVETLNSIICPVVPKIVVQKKANKNDVLNIQERRFYSVCCEVVEKLLSYYIEKFTLREYQKFKYDWLITGRGILWVSYKNLKDRDVQDEDVAIERVCWNDFAMDPKAKWQDVKWVARRFFLNKGEFVANFPDVDLSKVSFSNYKTLLDYEGEDIDFNLYATGDNFTEVWELWDKDTRHAMYLSQYYDDKMIKRIRIKEKKEYFLPTPEPIMALENNMNLKPRSEMWSYIHELEGLSRSSHRQDQLVDSMQAKAFVSSTFTDLATKVNEITEGYIATVNGLPSNAQNPIHYVDNNEKQKTIAGLAEYQKKLLHNIYEITGLTEVMRNISVEETATTARFRSKFGSMRLQMRQRLLADYMKQIYRIAANVATRNFSTDTIAEVTSIELRHQADINKDLQQLMMQESQFRNQINELNTQIEQAQTQMQQDQQMQQEQQQQQQTQDMYRDQQAEQQPDDQSPEPQPMDQAQPGPSPEEIQKQVQGHQQEMQQIQEKEMEVNTKITTLKGEASWEKVMDFLGKHKLSQFLLEVETDFDSLEEDPQITQERMQFLDIFIKTVQGAVPVMQKDEHIADLLTGLMSFIFDSFKMGRAQRGKIDEYLYNMTENIKMQAKKPKEQPPNPELMKAQAAVMEAQAKVQEIQMKQQTEQQKLQLKAQEMQMESQSSVGEMQHNSGHGIQKLQMQLQAQAERAQEKMQTDTNLMQMKIQADDNRYAKKAQTDLLKAEMQERNKLRMSSQQAVTNQMAQQNKIVKE